MPQAQQGWQAYSAAEAPKPLVPGINQQLYGHAASHLQPQQYFAHPGQAGYNPTPQQFLHAQQYQNYMALSQQAYQMPQGAFLAAQDSRPQSEANGTYMHPIVNRAHPTGMRSARRPANIQPGYQAPAVVDDYEVAQQLAEELGSSRPRRAAARQAQQNFKAVAEEYDSMSGSDSEEPSDRMALGLRSHPKQIDRYTFAAPEEHTGYRQATRPKPGRPRQSARAQRVSYAEEFDSELDSDPEEAAKKKTNNEALAALMHTGEQLDDEVERVFGHREAPDLEPYPGDPWASREFHVKWKRYSYIHCSWDTRETLSQLGGYKRVLNYMKKHDDLEAQRPYLSREEIELRDVERQMEEELIEDHMHVERVISQRMEPDGSLKYLVKWKGLPYGECTFETIQDIYKVNGQACIDAYQDRERRLLDVTRNVDGQRRMFKAKGVRALEMQPAYLKGGTLRDYQLEGLNWLIYSWSTDNNCILADEMGLGKTVQCVSMIGYLTEAQGIPGPFLVVVPLSTVPNWIREFRKWLPQANALVYVGDSKSREIIRTFEFYTGRSQGRLYKFDVIITTYELVLKDAATLGKIKWAYMMVDEAHRLKNNESALYQELISWSFKNKLLVTGTPLQNSMKELWALLHFLEPDKFPDCQAFEARHNLQKADEVVNLHAELRPHLLRRVIKDVERSLPPKNERILRVEMSPLQKQYYKWILSRNFTELNKGAQSGAQVSLLNIIVELKKTCNHPFLFEKAEDEYRGTNTDKNAVDRLIVTSGKMVLLDKLLKRLKETGHRVLIFSQMVRVLDIISDYMRLRGFVHQRLDGSTPAGARHQAMEHFNAPGSSDFAFLLSTRAGGLGINLATADTVIIFDSDWNPQNDLQAMSRAHRIGQTETVNIYRFLTSGSVEEDILERAKQKMVLDHLVIQRMDTSGRTVLDPRAAAQNAKQMFGKEELAAILRFGAEELFKEDENVKQEKTKQLYEEGIDAILARAEVVQDTKAHEAGGELLSSFNVATFKNEEDDTAFWNRLIPVDERAAEDAAAPEELGIRAARLKNVDDASARDYAESTGDDRSDSATPYKKGGTRTSRREPRASKKLSALAARPSGRKPGPPVDGALLRIDEWPAGEEGGEGGGRKAAPRRLSRRDAGMFVRAVKRFGLLARMPEIAKEVGPSMENASEPARTALWNALLTGCDSAVAAAASTGADASNAVLDFFGVPVKASEMASHVERMGVLAKKIEAVAEPEKHFRLEAVNLSIPKWGRECGWSVRDDAMLLLGVYWYGMGHWQAMADDERLRLGTMLAQAAVEKRTREPAQPQDPDAIVLPKGSHLETRVLALLKKLESTSRMSPAPPKPKPSRRSAREGPPKKRIPIDSFAAAEEDGRRMGNAAGASTSGRDRCETLLGEVMTEVKKLRLLQRKGKDMDRAKVVEKTRKYLVNVGDHIELAALAKGPDQLDRWRTRLWQFVAKYISQDPEQGMDGEKLARIYAKSKGGAAAKANPLSPGPSGVAATRLDSNDDGPGSQLEDAFGGYQSSKRELDPADEPAEELVRPKRARLEDSHYEDAAGWGLGSASEAGHAGGHSGADGQPSWAGGPGHDSGHHASAGHSHGSLHRNGSDLYQARTLHGSHHHSGDHADAHRREHEGSRHVDYEHGHGHAGHGHGHGGHHEHHRELRDWDGDHRDRDQHGGHR
ncbi:hypothetical protein WJX72_008454 [[Myrmecia] bisecta]|uniref:Uncharacterized protein n=1 Tax=[Myrmecia] bisecta TaxID=41462 RepID=A0AAW1QS12_9CHLO